MRALLNAVDGQQYDQMSSLSPNSFAPGGGPADPERPRYAMTYTDEVVLALGVKSTGLPVTHITVMGNSLGMSLAPSGVPSARAPMLLFTWRLGQ